MTSTPETRDKPIGRDLGLERVDTQYPYAGLRFRIRQDRVRLPDGNLIDFAYMESEGRRWLEAPRDPMAELVLVMGDPAVLAQGCSRRARLLEYLAAVCAFSALTVNLFLLLLIWHLLIP